MISVEIGVTTHQNPQLYIYELYRRLYILYYRIVNIYIVVSIRIIYDIPISLYEIHFCTPRNVRFCNLEDKNIVGKIPREIIYNQSLGEKRVMFYLQIYFSVTRSKELVIITDDEVRAMGFRPDAHKGRINDEFNSFVGFLTEWGYLKVSKKGRYYSRYHALSKIEEQTPYAVIMYDEFQKIIKNASNKSATLLLLAFIRLNSYKRKNSKDKHPEIYFGYLSEIANRLGVAIRSVSASLKHLSSLGILYGEEQRRFQDKHGNWHSGVYIFIDKVRYANNIPDQSYDWQSEFERASKWLIREQEKYIL